MVGLIVGGVERHDVAIEFSFASTDARPRTELASGLFGSPLPSALKPSTSIAVDTSMFRLRLCSAEKLATSASLTWTRPLCMPGSPMLVRATVRATSNAVFPAPDRSVAFCTVTWMSGYWPTRTSPPAPNQFWFNVPLV